MINRHRFGFWLLGLALLSCSFPLFGQGTPEPIAWVKTSPRDIAISLPGIQPDAYERGAVKLKIVRQYCHTLLSEFVDLNTYQQLYQDSLVYVLYSKEEQNVLLGMVGPVTQGNSGIWVPGKDNKLRHQAQFGYEGGNQDFPSSFSVWFNVPLTYDWIFYLDCKDRAGGETLSDELIPVLKSLGDEESLKMLIEYRQRAGKQ